MEKRKRINIGFDIGITSVGWAIVDEENNIIDRGVRLFKELKEGKKYANEDRRNKRHLRRTIRRQRNRKDDFIKAICRKYSDIFNFTECNEFEETKAKFLATIIDKNDNDILSIILDGLKKEIPKEKLLRVLYYYLSHRGYSYMTFEKYENINKHFNTIAKNNNYKEFIEWYKNNQKESKDIIELKAKELEKFYKEDGFKTFLAFKSAVNSYLKEKEYYNDFLNQNGEYDKKFPSVIQKNEFDKKGYFRDNEINQDFSVFDWAKEIKAILNNQSYITNEFREWYIDEKEGLFFRIRKFSEGPGRENSPSEYGIYRVDKETGKIVTLDNLWEQTMGKCSVYTNEYRADKKSSSAEISNLLNQLNTIKLSRVENGSKLTEEEKKQIIFDATVNDKKVELKTISKICKISIEDILGGYPTKTKKEKDQTINQANFEVLNNTKELCKLYGSKIKDFDDLIINVEKFNKIINIFANNPDNINGIKESLKLNRISDENEIEEILKLKIDSQSTSSMSLKALNQYIKEEIVDNGKTLNQKYKREIDINEQNKFKFDDGFSKYINVKCLDNEILSPTTKCSFRETLKVFNKILKKYIYNGSYYLKNIVLEMPTEWNSSDKKERETKIKNDNESMMEFIKKNYFYDAKNSSDSTYRKLVLLHKQKNKDIYTNEFIDYNKVINDDSYAQIDHIVPYSISYDDSWNNKVLVLRKSNQEKGQRVPREFLSTSKFNEMEKVWKELYAKDSSPFHNKRKYELLTIDLSNDFDKFNRSIGFVGRNMSDTRYACRVVNQALNAWLKYIDRQINENGFSRLCDIGDNIEIMNVNGQYTQRYRGKEYLDLKKDRDLDYSHHSVDATICALLGNSNHTTKRLIWYKKVDKENAINEFKSKFLDEKNKFQKSDENIPWKSAEFIKKVRDFKVKYSFKIQKKSNIGFYGDSLISVKKLGNTFKQFNNVYLLQETKYKEISAKMKDLIDLYGSDSNIKHDDPKMWSDILKAWNEGEKIRTSSKEFESSNPFKLYMQKYCEINNIPYQEKYLILERDGFKYRVTKVKQIKEINSFVPINKYNEKKMLNDEWFGVKTKLGWKEILLFTQGIDKKGESKYRVFPVGVNLLDNKLTGIDETKLNNLLSEYKITNPNYFVINYGQAMVNKENKNDIRKVVGIDFSSNKLDLQEIYKPTKQQQIAINTIMQKYDFCTIDILGNVTKTDIDKVFNKKEG